MKSKEESKLTKDVKKEIKRLVNLRTILNVKETIRLRRKYWPKSWG